MATFDYSELLEDVNALMDEFGQDGTIHVPAARTGDAWNPTVPADTTAACVLVEIDFARNESDGTNVLATDKHLLIKVGGLSANLLPSATKITYGGLTYQIIGPVKQINPGGTNLLWDVQARV